jgi:demethylmenaquinone methyltransferase/2-methoxy-6-polyprenyl-1,4-benzoquinol methylase
MTSDLFNRISSHYDQTNRWLSLGLDQRWRRSLLRHLPCSSFSLLDLATGTGDQIAAVIHLAKDAVGIDLSEEMLQIAKKKFAQKTFANRVQFLTGNAESLPFADETFDVCTISFGIRNVEHPKAALAEMFRVTRPKGRCLILEFSIPNNLFRRPYLFYLRHGIPFIGGWIANDPSAYRYLNQSIERFAKPTIFIEWMRECGWLPSVYPLLFGSLILYRGDKM